MRYTRAFFRAGLFLLAFFLSAGVLEASSKLKAPKPTASTNNSRYIKVKWSKVTGAQEFQLRRGTSTVYKESSVVATTTKRSYKDTSAIPGTSYYYWVLPVNEKGKAYKNKNKYAKGKRIFKKETSETIVVPTPNATKVETDQIKVYWKLSKGATRYLVYRNTEDKFSSAAEHIMTVTTNQMSDLSTETGKKYYYWVCPQNSEGRVIRNTKKSCWGMRKNGSTPVPPPDPGPVEDEVDMMYAAVDDTLSFGILINGQVVQPTNIFLNPSDSGIIGKYDNPMSPELTHFFRASQPGTATIFVVYGGYSRSLIVTISNNLEIVHVEYHIPVG